MDIIYTNSSVQLGSKTVSNNNMNVYMKINLRTMPLATLKNKKIPFLTKEIIWRDKFEIVKEFDTIHFGNIA